MVGLLLTLLAIYTFAAARPVLAQSQPGLPLRVRVDSVLASNTDQGVDAELNPDIAQRLRSMFDYSTYRLVLHQELETVCGHSVNFQMPGGGILHIAPHSIINNMISLELVLFEGPRPLMSSDLRMINHAVLMVGGPHYQQGMLITIITIGSADVPRLPGDHRSPPPAASPSSHVAPDGNAVPAGAATP